MKPFLQIPNETLAHVTTVFTDIDDTLTIHGRITSQVLAAIEQLTARGIRVVPVTGRPAGWCHGLARMWPVAGVVAENGAAAYWLKDNVQRTIYWEPDAKVRAEMRASLDAIARDAIKTFPFLSAAQDQFLRIGDIAFDLCENVAQLPAAQISALTDYLKARGLNTAVSTVHAHGYYGEPNKFSMTQRFVKEAWGEDFAALDAHAIFIGDSGNDVPMFAGFTRSIGVANVSRTLSALPEYVTDAREGEGFIELANALLRAKY
jgi:HAD superfamily hydrolase (TIGR01484 family)